MRWKVIPVKTFHQKIVKKELVMPSPRDSLDGLAQDFLQAWQEAHGVKSGRVSALSGSDHLAIIIEDSFSQAERKLAEGQSGEALLRQYAAELLNRICDQMSERIQQVVGRQVKASNVNVNPETDQVMFVFNLE
jgi:uncharacterized protein YbcI